MPTIKFIMHDGGEILAQGEAGMSVMKVATDAGVDGIVADCGGNASCATCHGYVDEAWIDRVAAPTPEETEMLECVLGPRESSRLTCQIILTPELDGLTITLPASQT